VIIDHVIIDLRWVESGLNGPDLVRSGKTAN
jgi:hypothetical protein